MSRDVITTPLPVPTEALTIANALEAGNDDLLTRRQRAAIGTVLDYVAGLAHDCNALRGMLNGDVTDAMVEAAAVVWHPSWSAWGDEFKVQSRQIIREALRAAIDTTRAPVAVVGGGR